jgi:hypothetical protein
LKLRLKSDRAKLQIAARLRRETTLRIRWVAERLSLGTSNSAMARLRARKRERKTSLRMLEFDPFMCWPATSFIVFATIVNY